MINYKIDTPLFKINYSTWGLLKNPETGLLFEPVPIEEFDRFEYWRDQFNTPVRQVICKNKPCYYADYLNLNTATLQRSVKSTLGWSAYDDEISKEQYEALCQMVLLKDRFKKLINADVLIPFQTLALTYFAWKEQFFIGKTISTYEINFGKLKLEKTNLSQEDIAGFKRISEYDFYYGIFTILIKKFALKLS